MHDLLKAVRGFEPRQLPVLTDTLADFHITNVAVNKWQIYTDIATNQEVPKDIVAFWCAVESLSKLGSSGKGVHYASSINKQDAAVSRAIGKFSAVTHRV